MKASHAWISALLPDLKTTPEELAARLPAAGIEVDRIDEYGAGTTAHDWILSVRWTPTPPQRLSHVGLAREVAALFHVPFYPPTPDAPRRVLSDTGIRKHVSVTVEDPERCPVYAVAMVTGVTIGPSPGWLRHRLESLGIQAISNVVDATSLILLESGQPVRAYDFDRIRGAKIVVRRDALDPDALVLADADGPIAAPIQATTRRVLLECADFGGGGNGSEIPDVLAQAASVVTEIAGGTAIPGMILEGAANADPV